MPISRDARRLLCVVLIPCAMAFSISAAEPTTSEPSPAGALRVRGIIDRDTRWSGHVLITDDASVQGATLTIAPGTIIEFARAPSRGVADAQRRGPILTIGSENGLAGWLTLESTRDQPIVFRTRAGMERGAIVIYARDLKTRRRAPGEGTSAAGLDLSDATFEALGSAEQPAVELHLHDVTQIVLVDRCTFDQCGRLRMVQVEASSAYISHNRMTQPVGAVCVDVERAGAGALRKPPSPGDGAEFIASEIRVHENHIAGAVRTVGASVEIDSNLLVGDRTCIMIEGRTSDETIVRDNYVHNTSPRVADGAFCLDSPNISAHIFGNILHGGAVVVSRGSGNMSRNVLIAAQRLVADAGRQAPAKSIVADLPPGALFEQNILIGPSHTMLRAGRSSLDASVAPAQPHRPQSHATQEASAANAENRRGSVTTIRRNTFDGGRPGSRGIVLASTTPCEVYDNLFISTQPAVVDENLGETNLRVLDFNARCVDADLAYRKVRPVDNAPVGENDVMLTGNAAQGSVDVQAVLAEIETGLTSGRIDTSAALKRLRAIYAPPAGSSLNRAGRPDAWGVRETIGAVGGRE